jgi:hypothetical protein
MATADLSGGGRGERRKRWKRTDRVAQLRGNAKVRELDLAAAVEENVGRLDVPVHALAGLEVRQRVKNLERDVAQRLFRNGAELRNDVFQRAAVHVLEREHDGAVPQERPEERHEARALAAQQQSRE